MLTNSFESRFNVRVTQESERAKFVRRVEQVVFAVIERMPDDEYATLMFNVIFRLGLDQEKLGSRSKNYWHFRPELKEITKSKFHATLWMLEALYGSAPEAWQQRINENVDAALNMAVLDIGVKWRGGVFLPINFSLLDQRLLLDPFDFLDAYPREKESFKRAIQKYNEKEYPDVIDSCYIALEGIARKVLGNAKTLENNRDELIKRLRLSQEWKGFLKKFIDYANEYKRHASTKHGQVIPIEVEAFLYFTGLLLRLLIESERARPADAT